MTAKIGASTVKMLDLERYNLKELGGNGKN